MRRLLIKPLMLCFAAPAAAAEMTPPKMVRIESGIIVTPAARLEKAVRLGSSSQTHEPIGGASSTRVKTDVRLGLKADIIRRLLFGKVESGR